MPTLKELEAEQARRTQGGSQGPSLRDLEAEQARRSGGMSTANDVMRTIPSALRTGTEMLLGLPGDVNQMTQGLVRKGSEAIFGKPTTDALTGMVPEGLKSEGATTSDVQAATEPYLGKPYEPKTTPGRWTRSVVEQVPGAAIGPGRLVTKGLSALGAGLASEGAAELTEGSGYEDWARALGAIVGGGAPTVLARNPNAARDLNYRRNVDLLEDEGVPLTAGQRTGRTATKYIESELGGSGFDDAINRQHSVFTDRAMRRLGEEGGTALPEDLARARARIGSEFERLEATTPVAFDQQLQNDLLRVTVDYADTAPQVAPAVERMMNRMSQVAAQNGGVLTGENYRQFSTRLRELSESAEGTTALALDNMRASLDDAVERSLPAGSPELEAWRDARRQYANLLTVERAMTGRGVEAASGMIPPTALRGAISGGGNGPAAIAEGRSNMTDLANAGVSVLGDMPPQSGSAPRLWARGLASTGGAVAGGLASGGDPLAAGATAVAGGVLGPWLTGKAVMHPIGQGLLAGPSEGERQLLARLLAGTVAAQQGGRP